MTGSGVCGHWGQDIQMAMVALYREISRVERISHTEALYKLSWVGLLLVDFAIELVYAICYGIWDLCDWCARV